MSSPSDMSEDQIMDLPDVEDAGEEGMFNTADIVVFVLFVVVLIVFFFSSGNLQCLIYFGIPL